MIQPPARGPGIGRAPVHARPRGTLALQLGAGALAVAVLSGCAAPVRQASPTPDPDLAVPADDLAPSDQPTGTLAPRPSPTATQPTDDPPSPDAAAPDPGPGTPSPDAPTDGQASPDDPASDPSGSPPPGWTTLLRAEDPADDQGASGPGFADLVAFSLEDDGTAVRVRVDVAEDVPPRLEEGEVVGLGVDLLRGSDGESRYQLYADGGVDGWAAYLQTPDGFVAYPGTFAIGGRRFEFVVPWSALGDPTDGPAAVFLDWSRRAIVGALNPSSGDRAPDAGDLNFTR